MGSNSILMVLLTATLLALASNGLNWQGMGNGINNTVISKVWDNIETKLNPALTLNSAAAYNNLTKDISDQLVAQWDPAWNVVLIKAKPQYDTILYGYAFRNQWMWFNGVPNSVLGTTNIITLIVWKDYNCRDWKNIADGVTESSQFSEAQMIAIQEEADRMDEYNLKNDIWVTAYRMMNSLQPQTAFSAGSYTVIMSQYGLSKMYGYVCRVGNNFKYKKEVLNLIDQQAGQVNSYGSFYIFQTK